MYEITVKKTFAAAHRLPNYKGRCAAVHGHTWTVEVSVAGVSLDENGMLIDFILLKEMVTQITMDFDHQYLNELKLADAVVSAHPTAENLARYIFKQLSKLLPPNLSLTKVKVWESADTAASYQEGV
ncbi:MAG TPA: 6-carboxytetrahydropterin synthase QueD [Desulfotomaculum sp.]|nr:6-carboxytetrahydropterin synthase QueD [Desulfotomaculum sp.]